MIAGCRVVSIGTIVGSRAIVQLYRNEVVKLSVHDTGCQLYSVRGVDSSSWQRSISGTSTGLSSPLDTLDMSALPSHILWLTEYGTIELVLPII
ncbi:hypothetical protein GYMLUDRAFT_77847 [Collybiopsis luxurians FD-317 M1]|uniref:Uncharacterized protein n=1 Tax=Collybiopsis luxurians FD-317 M1 TaxID=944289 RepID=A0A0D0BCW1_9AGAR|nr:hypothetical protein GYMLUDRAFT_77847 [Collybiopsis luxurians FD-317 M1]